MSDLTYTAKGNYNSATGKMNVQLMIPPEISTNKYIISPCFDISKFVINGSNINAILCHLSLENDPGIALNSNTYNYNLEIDIAKLVNYKSNADVKFDLELEDSLLFIFHNDILNMDDLKPIYDNIEKLNEYVKLNGNFNSVLNNTSNPSYLKPKNYGSSYIVKL